MKLECLDNFSKKKTKLFSFCFNLKAFTMIELLVVVAIIGILSGLIAVGMSDLNKKARDSKRVTEINSLRKAIWMKSNMGSTGYPIQASWCCMDKGGCSVLSSALVPDFLGKLPSDPLYSSSNEEWCYMYKSDGTTFDLYAKLEEKGSVSLSPESIKISTIQTCSDLPGEWIDSGLGFCVMKWEARDDGTGKPTSTGTGLPWVSITQVDAISKCKSIGAHLLNNAEWMSLARDIESVSSNYVSGSLKRGNVGLSDSISYNGSDPESGVTNALATLSLSSGQTINHLSGNVWEWVDYTISGTDSQPVSPSQTWAWRDINTVTNWGSILGYENVGPKNKSLNGSTGSGQVYYQSGYTTERAFIRGGGWDNGSHAGVFALNLSGSPAYTYTNIGFRCAR